MAAKEILLVTCVVASGGLGLTFVERLANPLPDWHRATSASQRELLIQQAVPVTDEFDCLVTVDRFSGTSPLSQPFHVSHLQFVRRPAADLTVWLLEVSTNELDGWPDLAACSEWALVQAGSPGDAVNAAGGDRTQQSDPTGQPAVAAEMIFRSGTQQQIRRLEECLWQYVPQELLQTGTFTMLAKPRICDLHELDGFPLNRLASAIRSAARRENWPVSDPGTLLATSNRSALSGAMQQALAQSLIVRFLEALPPNPSPQEPPSCEAP